MPLCDVYTVVHVLVEPDGSALCNQISGQRSIIICKGCTVVARVNNLFTRAVI